MTMRFLALILLLNVLGRTAHADSELLFTRHDGLSGAGVVVLNWVAKAPLHGLGLTLDPIVRDWIANPGNGQPGTTATQLKVEASLEASLSRLVAELPPAPRTTPVLADPATNYYLSPDVTWRNATPRTAAPTAMAAANAAARSGDLDNYLSTLLPSHPQYSLLVAAAERYTAICAAGGWTAVTPPKVGKKKNWVPPPDLVHAYQARLAKEGFYLGAPSGTWDEASAAALTRFRAARQVADKAKGLDDPDTLQALAVPCEARLGTLLLNVKRWRVSAWNREPTYVEVNLAAQELRYVRDAQWVMTQRTIVGSSRWYFDRDLGRRLNVQATPILADHISRIVVNPTWAVPPRIAKNEIDAHVASDPTYLERNRMQLVESARGRTYIQSPGQGNALGVIKILFPNDESIYLHDTPKKGPFKLAVRALSHGCVRVQNAVDFGMALLSADAAAAGREFDEAAMRGRTGRGGSIIIDLTAEVPVFLEYYTASIDSEGVVRFHPDIYGYDAEIGDIAR